ncbi:hypothetical protein Xant_20490 [Xanthomonas cissicola]|uniref:Uncharacterized protein n=1 Tax=Xanthomonas cissicola TaxID=86186 RepID=A0ABX3M514_9XANT|nr:hypothetical protein Xant_20490 [Xanthomonas cissicola]
MAKPLSRLIIEPIDGGAAPCMQNLDFCPIRVSIFMHSIETRDQLFNMLIKALGEKGDYDLGVEISDSHHCSLEGENDGLPRPG